MPIKKYQDFLDEETYEHTIGTAEYVLTLGGNELCTNRWWDYGIRKDSFPVFVHNIYQDSDLHKKLKAIIEDKTGLKKNSLFGNLKRLSLASTSPVWTQRSTSCGSASSARR